MPPITRHQAKKSTLKTEPYSKENRPAEKRNALQDLVANNDMKVVTKTTKTDIKKSDNRIFINDNITKTENTNRLSHSKSEVSKPVVTKTPESTQLSINNSKEITLYHSIIEKEKSSKDSQTNEELYETAVDKTQRQSLENNTSELYHSTVQEPTSNSFKEHSLEDTFEIDARNWNNLLHVGCYARDIFEYLRHREERFNVHDYMSIQSEITPRHRAIVVNWLVDLQEIYGLNHEVLYMAVKIMDLYLMSNPIEKDSFQLLASGAILLASKIDVREAGFPYDLVKQSKYLFTEDELFLTEREVVKALDYDLNIPLSYGFLRRFARCMKCQMFLLTLARYILESSLLDYSFVTFKESLKAAASLYLAFKMCSQLVDANEFRKVTGYSFREIKDTVIALNNMLYNQSKDLCNVKIKYMHETFFKVASKPLLSNSKLKFD